MSQHVCYSKRKSICKERSVDGWEQVPRANPEVSIHALCTMVQDTVLLRQNLNACEYCSWINLGRIVGQNRELDTEMCRVDYVHRLGHLVLAPWFSHQCPQEVTSRHCSEGAGRPMESSPSSFAYVSWVSPLSATTEGRRLRKRHKLRQPRSGLRDLLHIPEFTKNGFCRSNILGPDKIMEFAGPNRYAPASHRPSTVRNKGLRRRRSKVWRPQNIVVELKHNKQGLPSIALVFWHPRAAHLLTNKPWISQQQASKTASPNTGDPMILNVQKCHCDSSMRNGMRKKCNEGAGGSIVASYSAEEPY